MSAGPPRLFEEYPQLQERFGWLPLVQRPTPVEELTNVGHQLGMPSLWVKRDDVSGKRYGGNKTRKLEFLLGQARLDGHDTLITMGGWGSHHGLATAIYGKAEGFDVDLVYFPQAPTTHVRESFEYSQSVGANLIKVPSPMSALIRMRTQWLIHRWNKKRPLIVAPGGSSPIGTLGFVDAALELATQIRQGDCPCPDYVWAPAGSLGTIAGLVCGFALAGLEICVVGARVVDRTVTNHFWLRKLIRETWHLLKRSIGTPLGKAPVSFDHAVITDATFSGQYGKPTDLAARARDTFRLSGLELELTYTGPVAAALALIGPRREYCEKTHLFWMTFDSVLTDSKEKR